MCVLSRLVVSDSFDPWKGDLPGSSVHGILQAGILEWVAIAFSRDLPDPGIEPRSPEPSKTSALGSGDKWMDYQAGALPQSISTPRRESGSICPYVGCVASHTEVSLYEPRMFLRDDQTT